MKSPLSIDLDDRIQAYLKAEAAYRGTTPEKLGEFAVDLFIHYAAKIRGASAVILQAPAPEKPLRYIVYATTIPQDNKITLAPVEASARRSNSVPAPPRPTSTSG